MGPKREAPSSDGAGDAEVKKAKTDAGETVKRGRGRPRIPEHLKKTKPKVPSGRGRGRPKKSEAKAKSANAVKKGGRGRPKKITTDVLKRELPKRFPRRLVYTKPSLNVNEVDAIHDRLDEISDRLDITNTTLRDILMELKRRNNAKVNSDEEQAYVYMDNVSTEEHILEAAAKKESEEEDEEEEEEEEKEEEDEVEEEEEEAEEKDVKKEKVKPAAAKNTPRKRGRPKKPAAEDEDDS